MVTPNKNKIKINNSKILNIVAILMLAYFIFHSVYGTRGALSYFRLQAELKHAHQKLEILRAERLEIENRTKLLRHESIDRDMLDEKIRNVLGFSAPGEKVFKKSEEIETESIK